VTALGLSTAAGPSIDDGQAPEIIKNKYLAANPDILEIRQPCTAARSCAKETGTDHGHG
jgi:hypothetical protein